MQPTVQDSLQCTDQGHKSLVENGDQNIERYPTHA